jgi:glucose-1-phosphate cytidylyltransferase
MIKEYFANYFLHRTDVTIDLKNNSIKFHDGDAEAWNITLADTGIESMTGGRIKRVKPHIGNETFLLTYGDGVSNVNVEELVSHHKKQQKMVTVTAVQPSGKFGALSLTNEHCVQSFVEKPKGDGAWINGGFFVCEPEVFNYLEGDKTVWEKEPLERIARSGQMSAYKHTGFWKPMDTLRDKMDLEENWQSGNALWKIW